MKAVISGILPTARFIDITHAIPRGSIQQASFEIWRTAPYLPPGTVLLAVVDPGVGTERKPVALQTRGLRCVGPDNGIYTYLISSGAEMTAVEISEPGYMLETVSSTFHGRDIFAPAAAHLAAGLDLRALGPKVNRLATHALPVLDLSAADAARGEVVHIDHFGNLITSIGTFVEIDGLLTLTAWFGESLRREFDPSIIYARLGEAEIPFQRTFGAVSIGEPVAYIGSSGLLEVAVNGGNAARQFGVGLGHEITFRVKG